MLGLYLRRQTGFGSFIDLSQYRMLASTLRHEIVAAQLVDPEALTHAQRNNRDIRYTPQGCYECATDDTWIVVSIRNDEEWQRLVQIIADPRLDPLRTASARERRASEPTIQQVLQPWIRAQSRDELAARLTAAGIASAPVLEPFELLFDPQLHARNAFEWVDFAAQGWPRVRPHFRTPWRFVGCGIRQGSPAPAALGGDTAFYLREYLGYDSVTLADLERERVTGTRASDQVRAYVRDAPEEMVRRGQVKGYDPTHLSTLRLYA